MKLKASSRIIVLAAGGTGGHIFPAVALAEVLRTRGYEPHLVTDHRFHQYNKASADGVLGQIPIHTIRAGSLGGGVVPLTINGNSAEIPDALALLSLFYSSEGVFSVHTHFKDAQIDKLIGQLSQTDDLGKRAALVSQVGRRGNELLPFATLPEAISTHISRSSLKGVKENYNPFRFTRLFWNSLSK